jgi:hypothetical protein
MQTATIPVTKVEKLQPPAAAEITFQESCPPATRRFIANFFIWWSICTGGSTLLLVGTSPSDLRDIVDAFCMLGLLFGW